ncbi:MAG: response regulator transcription factor [Alphaproteobacteria bacterium]|nr:response regulator transcription factor [Alphaproteobacteria bacterium]
MTGLDAKRPKIYLVEDDPDLAGTINEYLSEEGMEVVRAADGASARRRLARGGFDLVVVDLGLPDESGLDLTRHVRSTSQAGIVILTGRGDPVDRVVGLEIGADDYLGKPVHLRELLARIRSVLRRTSGGGAAAPATANDTILAFADWTLDCGRRRLVRNGGADITLSAAEFELLRVLALHAQRVLSRDQLLDMTRHRSAGPFDRSIDVMIGKLRRKIEENPREPSLIKTVHGAGYVLAAPVVTRR